ncbi:VWA domain-containing protein [Phenylobacterium sp.]|uniref:vWA domain-containing protein n=1 Tax=Phenylobacterium sp. TaxID=1871053 RepID=UPI002735A56E|nr:VWA domain-containing protein [Phenylobacterium sp.]MDP3853381.1 VWA domain-containing protein [Phenylobacterium sp.]
MSGSKTVRSVSLVALAALIAASSPTAPTAQPAYRDGAPTPGACETLGFSSVAEERDSYRGPPQIGRPMPPPPPPRAIRPRPPNTTMLAVPPVESRIEEMVVTGGRSRSSASAADAAKYAPAPYPTRPRVDTERYPAAQANPIKQVVDEPVSTFSVDVDTAAYSNVRRFLTDGRRPPVDAVRVEELVNYFDYGYPAPADRAAPFRPFVAVTPSPWSAQRQVLHVGLQGYDAPRAAQPPLNLVFLIDTSGSMNPEDRLPLARKSLNLLIDQLRPQDRVAMVAYAGSAGAVLAPTGGRQKLKMRCALEALHSGGSTAGGAGLALAYGLARQNFDPEAVNRVILVTDGDFNVGVADPAKLKDFVAEQRKTGVYLSVYGYGRGNYNDVMMQTLAQNGNGTAAYVDTLNEARKLFRDDFTASLFPIADDVKIQVEFNPAVVSEYRLIGYETRMLAREDFNNDRVDAGEVGAGASVTALYEITPTGAAPSSDPLRYGARTPPRPSEGREIAFLKVRYKLPGGRTSHLMERPIGARDVYDRIDAAPEPARWALAVAGFGQKLRGDPRLEDRFGWPQVAALAQGARGEDPFGLRAEFVQLVRNADTARSVNE